MSGDRGEEAAEDVLSAQVVAPFGGWSEPAARELYERGGLTAVFLGTSGACVPVKRVAALYVECPDQSIARVRLTARSWTAWNEAWTEAEAVTEPPHVEASVLMAAHTGWEIAAQIRELAAWDRAKAYVPRIGSMAWGQQFVILDRRDDGGIAVIAIDGTLAVVATLTAADAMQFSFELDKVARFADFHADSVEDNGTATGKEAGE